MPIIKNASSPAEKGPLRVLVVDDQVIVRGMVRSALEKLERDILIIEAEKGDEARDIMCSSTIDIIFCDVHLPGMSGVEALLEAYSGKKHRPFVVLMSSFATRVTEAMMHRVGAYEFMPKPFRVHDVIEAIEAYDRLNQAISVLVIDDSATVRRLIARIFDRSQFHIVLHEAASGAEALSLAKNVRFDVVFCDFNMPGLNGVATSGLLLQLNPATQIVMISTEQPTSLVRSAQFVGVFAFLRKPFNASDVNIVLHDAFALKRPSIAPPTHAIFSNEEAIKARGTAVSRSGNGFGAAGVA